MLKELSRRTAVAAREVKKDLGLEFYTKPQEYEVEYCVDIQNLGSEKNNVEVIIPCAYNYDHPYDSPYQKGELLSQKSDPRFSFKLYDEEYKNAYISIEQSLYPERKRTIIQRFKVRVEPRNEELNPKTTIEEYDAKRWWPPGVSPRHYDSTNHFADHRIRELSKRIVGNEKRILEILKIFNEYIINNLNYGDPTTGLYTASDALTRDKVDCGGYATLMIALCRTQGIPARLVSGFWAGYKNNGMHAWAEILYPHSKWIPVDPCIEQLFRLGRTSKYARLGFTGSDRIVFSVGCDFEILKAVEPGKVKIPILQNPIVFASQGEKSFDVSSKVMTIRK